MKKNKEYFENVFDKVYQIICGIYSLETQALIF
jgi:hypothetical protein